MQKAKVMPYSVFLAAIIIFSLFAAAIYINIAHSPFCSVVNFSVPLTTRRVAVGFSGDFGKSFLRKYRVERENLAENGINDNVHDNYFIADGDIELNRLAADYRWQINHGNAKSDVIVILTSQQSRIVISEEVGKFGAYSRLYIDGESYRICGYSNNKEFTERLNAAVGEIFIH